MSSDGDNDALKLLKACIRFSFASNDLLEALSQIMTLQQVEEGHIFVEEGQEIAQFLILEQGTLARYKLGSQADGQNTTALIQASFGANDTGGDDEKPHTPAAVLIDTLQGYGYVSGWMHSLEPGEKAFATVVAHQGPAKVWTIAADDFRALLQSNAQFSFQFLQGAAKRLRQETKVSRALLQGVGRNGGMSNDDDFATGTVLRVMCYDTTSWVRNGFGPALQAMNEQLQREHPAAAAADGTPMLTKIEMDFTEERLSPTSAAYSAGYHAVCTFVNDVADRQTIQTLSMLGVKMISQRAAGFDRIDVLAAQAFGMTVARVPAYSPYAVAEMAVALLMAVNRKISKASSRVKMANFTLDEGLMGMDIYGKTVGVMGTGKIGAILCNIMMGFGAKIICYDVFQNQELIEKGCTYVSKDEIFAQSDVLFLMMPLLPPTKHTINMDMLDKLKKGVILINTSRGGLVDTKALLHGIKTGIIAGVGADVYENEGDYFFQDWSAKHIPDDDLVALLGQHAVVLTAHQAFFTKEAVQKIVATTLENLRDFGNGKTGYDHPNNCIPKPK